MVQVSYTQPNNKAVQASTVNVSKVPGLKYIRNDPAACRNLAKVQKGI